MSDMTIYIISGLGADERVFSKLSLPSTVVHLNWIKNKPKESLSMYAKRMAVSISDSKNAILIGLSFGGIVAQEIAAQREIGKLIIINSVKTRNEIPLHLRLVGDLGLHKLFPTQIFSHPLFKPISYFFFSLKTREEKVLLDQIFDNADYNYIEWCIDKVLKWPGKNKTINPIHIHSKGDRIFPARNIKVDALSTGDHFAVFSISHEVDEILGRLLL